MKKKINLFLIVLLSFLFFAVKFSPELCFASDQNSENKSSATIFKFWRYIDGAGDEVITINPSLIQSKISGPGLPKKGLEMEKKVAKIVPGPTSKNGFIITGPDETLSQPYKVIHWFDLKSDEVKLYIDPKVFPTVQAAEKDSKVDINFSKTYRSIRWGI